METLTKEEAIRRHRELWHKIADMQETSSRPILKDEALAALGFRLNPPRNDCWCCEYTRQFDHDGCDFCPVKWSRSSILLMGHTRCYNSYYYLWTRAIKDKKLSEAARYAKMIADLPESEFEDCGGDQNE